MSRGSAGLWPQFPLRPFRHLSRSPSCQCHCALSGGCLLLPCLWAWPCVPGSTSRGFSSCRPPEHSAGNQRQQKARSQRPGSEPTASSLRACSYTPGITLGFKHQMGLVSGAEQAPAVRSFRFPPGDPACLPPSHLVVTV